MKLAQTGVLEFDRIVGVERNDDAGAALRHMRLNRAEIRQVANLVGGGGSQGVRQ